MTKHQKNAAGQSLKEPGKPFGRRGLVLLAGAVLVLMLVMVGLWKGKTPSADGRAGGGSGTNYVAVASPSKPTCEKLVGKWVRPDGGYIIEIKSAGADGKLDAGYFNPRPIHVARAEASGEGSMIKVFIELQDVNYPGSTYTLAYDLRNDVLKGVYYQAVEQQHYEVEFERMRE